MRVISNTVVLFVIIYCADEIRGKKRNRNNENEILKKTEIMLTKNQRLNVGIFGPIKRNMVQVEPVLEQCKSTNFTSAFKKLRSKVRCKPRDMPVDLKNPPNSFMIPNTVIVKRCGGACNGGKKCIYAERRNVTFFVRMKNGTDVTCTSVSVPEDISCRCGCPVECSKNHSLDKDTCTCKCKNPRPTSCLGYSMWDEDNCTCRCSKNCTTGTRLDPKECKCIKD